MKRRIEKKYVNQFRSGWCESCGEDHGGQRKVDRARELRVERTMRRVRRNDAKRLRGHNDVLKAFVFDMKVDTSKFVAAMNHMAQQLYGIRDFFDGVAKNALGDLSEKKFTGIRNESGIEVDAG